MSPKGRGRPNKAAPRIVHYLIREYPEKKTLSEISEKLKLKTNVVDYNLSRVLSPKGFVTKNENTKLYHVPESACIDVMREYCYSQEGVPYAEGMVSYLSSEYADKVLLSPMGFNALVSRAQVKWLIMHGPRRLQELHDLLPRVTTQVGGTVGRLLEQHKAIIPLLIRHYNLRTPLDQVNQEMRLLIPSLTPTQSAVNQGYPNPWFDQNETRDLCDFIRFAPSLITYISTDDYHHGIPTDFLLDPLVPDRNDFKRYRDIARHVKRSFRRFYATLVASFAVHDIATYGFLSDSRVLNSSRMKTREDDFNFNYLLRRYRGRQL